MIKVNWIYIVKKDLQTIVREKAAWITMILLPVIVIVVAGFALSGIIGGSEVKMNLVYFYDGTEDDISSLLHGLEEMQELSISRVDSLKEGIEMVEKSKATALLEIPQNFQAGYSEEEMVLTYHYDISSQSMADVLYGIIMGNVKSLNNSFSTVKMLVNQQEEDGVFRKENIENIITDVEKEYHGKQSISLKQEEIGGDSEMRSFYQIIPGFAVMFLLFSILAGSGKLIEERNNKTLRRILVSNTKRRDILIGKWIGMSLQGFLQSLILFAIGAVLFGISLGNLFYLICFLLVAALCTGAIGIFIASISKSFAQATGISMLLFMVMSALGGSWWPLEITPDFMQIIGKLTLNYWAVSGIKKIIMYNLPLLEVGLEIGVLSAVCIAFLLLAHKVFKVE